MPRNTKLLIELVLILSMGLLTKLFGAKNHPARDLVIAEERRLELWDMHIENFSNKSALAGNFNFATVDKAVADFNKTKGILEKIEALVNPELINIQEEEKTEAEIISDLKNLKHKDILLSLGEALVRERGKEEKIKITFEEIHNVLKVELHLIQIIRTEPKNVRELLLQLFTLINFHEQRLYKPFISWYYLDENKPLHAEVTRFARAALLEEKIEEQFISEEELFAETIYKVLGKGSKGKYRKLAEAIFLTLAERVGAPFGIGADIEKPMKDMETLIENDQILYEIIKKLKPREEEKTIKAMVIAFRKAHNEALFEELYASFIT